MEDLPPGINGKCERFPVQDGIVLVKDPCVQNNADADVDDEVEDCCGRPPGREHARYEYVGVEANLRVFRVTAPCEPCGSLLRSLLPAGNQDPFHGTASESFQAQKRLAIAVRKRGSLQDRLPRQQRLPAVFLFTVITVSSPSRTSQSRAGLERISRFEINLMTLVRICPALDHALRVQNNYDDCLRSSHCGIPGLRLDVGRVIITFDRRNHPGRSCIAQDPGTAFSSGGIV